LQRFRLNGWQRLGVILSVIWIFVGPAWAWQELFAPVSQSYAVCMDVANRADSTAKALEWIEKCHKERREDEARRKRRDSSNERSGRLLRQRPPDRQGQSG
jgi:hypothetical protein